VSDLFPAQQQMRVCYAQVLDKVFPLNNDQTIMDFKFSLYNDGCVMEDRDVC
jgi:hypothetical protein